MFRRLLASFLIIALLLQSGREAMIGLWYWANQEWVTEQYCINKSEPLPMCQGKCYLQEVLEEENSPASSTSSKIFITVERLIFQALPASRLFKARSSLGARSEKPHFFYLPPHSIEFFLSLLRPPWNN